MIGRGHDLRVRAAGASRSYAGAIGGRPQDLLMDLAGEPADALLDAPSTPE